MTTGTDAFAQGKLAFQNNHPMSSCQYPSGSAFRNEWMRGWMQARNASPRNDRAGGMKQQARSGGVGGAK